MSGNYEQLYDEYYDKVYVYIACRVRRRQDAEDLTAEVFLKAFASPYNPKLAGFSTYIFTIAANLLKNHYRNTAKMSVYITGEEPSEDLPDEQDILGGLITREEHAALQNALAALPERDYQVVYLRYFLEQPFREIGAALGVTEDHAKKIHARALEKIKKFLKICPFSQSRVYNQSEGGGEHDD